MQIDQYHTTYLFTILVSKNNKDNSIKLDQERAK